MPLNAETDAVLKELEASGFDLSSVRQQAQANPLLENIANAKLGGGILRREEYVKFKTQADEEVTSLRQRVRELAANQDALKNFEGNDELYKQALEVIETQRENLVAAGFDPEEVKSLSMKVESGLKSATSKADVLDKEKPKVEDRTVPNDNDFVKTDELQTVLANLAGGNLIGGMRAQRQLFRAQQLGIEVTDELADKFGENLLKGLQTGKSYDQIADETFGFSAILETKRKEAEDVRVESRARELAAEKLKEAGVSTTSVHVARTRSPMEILATTRGVDADMTLEGSGGHKLINGRKVPVNKDGEVEYHRIRGDRSSRIQHGVETWNKLGQERPDIFEDNI
jgi:hypothetical protein